MVKSNCNNIAKRLLIVFFSLIALAAEAKQVTITPVRGSRWFLGVEEFGYLRIVGDSLIIIRNAGDTCAREALVNVQRIAVEESEPTVIKRVPFPIPGRKVLEPNGRIVIQQGGKRYGIRGY